MCIRDRLVTQRVVLEGMILKPNMVLPGLDCKKQETVDEVADATVHTLLRAVPAAVPVVAFLSGGQSAELASARLNAMNVRFKSRLPWALAFSYGRAIQEPALQIWHGDLHKRAAAQAVSYTHLDVYKRQGQDRRLSTDFRSREPSALIKCRCWSTGNIPIT